MIFGLWKQTSKAVDTQDAVNGPLSFLTSPTIRDVAHAAYLSAFSYPLAIGFIAVVAWSAGDALVSIRRSAPRTVSMRSAMRALVERGLQSPGIVVAVAWLAVPLAIGYGLSHLIIPIFYPRYTIAVSIGVYLLLGVSLAHLARSRVGLAAAGLVVALAAVNLFGYLRAESGYFGAPSQYVATHARSGDAVLFDMNRVVFDYYAQRHDLREVRIRDPWVADTKGKDVRTLVWATRLQRVWILIGSNRGSDQTSDADLLRPLRATFGAPQVHERLTRFDVYLFSKKPRPG